MQKKYQLFSINSKKGLHILFFYHIIDTLTHKRRAVKWKVVGTRIAVVYVKGFSMEQVYDKIIGERRLL